MFTPILGIRKINAMAAQRSSIPSDALTLDFAMKRRIMARESKTIKIMNDLIIVQPPSLGVDGAIGRLLLCGESEWQPPGYC